VGGETEMEDPRARRCGLTFKWSAMAAIREFLKMLNKTKAVNCISANIIPSYLIKNKRVEN